MLARLAEKGLSPSRWQVDNGEIRAAGHLAVDVPDDLEVGQELTVVFVVASVSRPQEIS